MDNDKYFEILGKIRELKPVISDSQALTAKTMLNIEQMSKGKYGSKTLTRFNWATSIAASFLLGLFLFEHFGSNNNPETNSSATAFYRYVSGYNIDTNKTLNRSDVFQFIHQKKTLQKKLQTFYSNVSNNNKNL
ncbi:MAG: hypothetical protein FWC41_13320 [Firmicutes bacterium]|nr:hypothetical protein [Bacillota bacterium]